MLRTQATCKPSEESLNYFNWDDLLNLDKSPGDLSDPGHGGGAGWQLQPLHPTEPGHTDVKNAIKAAM